MTTASHRSGLAGQWLPTRRDFLKSAISVTGVVVVGSDAPRALAERASELIDVNVSLGDWPVRRLRCSDAPSLVAKLRSRGVTQAWTGSLDGVLHKDLTAVNARLAAECKKSGAGILLPFGSIDPKLPDWESELRRCVEVHRMRGIRLHPNYHNYGLSDPALGRLLAMAAAHRLIIQIALVLEDERMMHPLLRVEPVDPKPLPALAKATPGLQLVLLNALRTLRGDVLRSVVSAGDISFEIAMLEGVAGIQNLLKDVPVGRILFGSHSPLFYFESAELKLRESVLDPEQMSALRSQNAQNILKKAGGKKPTAEG